MKEDCFSMKPFDGLTSSRWLAGGQATGVYAPFLVLEFMNLFGEFTNAKGCLTNFSDDERESRTLLFVFQFPNNLQSDKPELTSLGYNLRS